MSVDNPASAPVADGTGTLTGLLEAATRRNPSEPFLLCPERDWTYGEFAEAVSQFGAGLRGLGVTSGDRIAIAAPNSAQWLITWFAAAQLGAVLVTLNVAYREHEFDYMLNQSGAFVLVCATADGAFDLVAFVDGLRPRMPAVQHVVFLGDDPRDVGLRWSDLLTPNTAGSARESAAGYAARPEDPAVILYTSGTTGHPKGATLTHASIVASARAQAQHLGQRADDVAIGHMPLNHVGGMTCTVVASMVATGRVALLPRYSPQVALDTIGRHRVSIFIGVPTMYALMMGLPEFSLTDTTSVRTCVIGGSNVEPAMAQRIVDSFHGARLANLYGLSETSGGSIISAAGDDMDTLATTLGVAIGDFEVRVTDDSHQPLSVGAEGELEIRGGCVARGYWDRPDDTAQSFLADGWLATGDIAVLRADGRVALRGRKKEMYVRSGYNVYPVEIENLLAKQDAVAMSAVIGIPDELHGEVGHAFVVPAPGAAVDVGALLAVCATHLARYKIPAKITVVPSLPLTPSGKFRKVALRGVDGPDANPAG